MRFFFLCVCAFYALALLSTFFISSGTPTLFALGDSIKIGSVFYEDDTFDILQGLLVAELEHKHRNFTYPTNVEYLLSKGNASVPINIETFNQAEKLIVEYHVDAFVNPQYRSTIGTVNAARKHKIPVVNICQYTTDAFTQKNDHVFNLKMPPLIAYYIIFMYALKLRGCYWSGVVSQLGNRESQELTDEIHKMFHMNKLPSLPVFFYNKGDTAQEILKFVFDKEKGARKCLFFTVGAPVSVKLMKIIADSPLWKPGTVLFFGLQGIYRADDWDPFYNNAFADIRVVTFLPPYNYRNSRLTYDFEKYFDIFLKKHSGNVTVGNYSFKVLPLPSYDMFEAYVAMKYYLSVLNQMFEWVPENQLVHPSPQIVIKAFYYITIYIGDFKFFPAINRTFLNGFNQMKFCNSVNRVAFILEVSNTSGRLTTPYNDQGVQTRYIMDYLSCGENEIQNKIFPAHVTSFLRLENDHMKYKNMVTFNNMAVLTANSLSVPPYIGFTYKKINMSSLYDDISETLKKIFYNSKPNIYLINEIGEVLLFKVKEFRTPVLLPYGITVIYHDPILVSRQQNWNPYVFYFLYSYADIIYTLVDYYVKAYSTSRIACFSDSAEGIKLIKKTLATFDLKQTIKMVNKQLIKSHLDAKDYVLYFPLRKKTLVDVLLSINNTGRGIFALAIDGRDIVSVFNDFNQNVKDILANSTASILFAQNFDAWWRAGPVFTILIKFIDHSLIRMPAMAVACLFGGISSSIIRSTNVESDYAEVLYKMKTISLSGVNYGPFSNSTCSRKIIKQNAFARQCQCTKGPRLFFVLRIQDWAHNRTTPPGGIHNTYYGTCGVPYKPYPVSNTLKYIAIILGTVIPLLVLFGAFFIYRYLTNQARFAPKDPTLPFSMVFTDIQSSTFLWAKIPEIMTDAVNQHHKLIRLLIYKEKGYEVKTIGDSFMIAFKRASNAVNLARDLQLAFYEEDWDVGIDEAYIEFFARAMETEEDKAKHSAYVELVQMPTEEYNKVWHGIRVRVGIHYGYGNIQKDPTSKRYDYYGTAVNTTARVEGVGHGGQILITDSVYEELRKEKGKKNLESYMENFVFVDLGQQPLRGLDAPVVLYELVPVSLQGRIFPPLRLDIEVIRDNATEGDHTETLALNDRATLDITVEDHVRTLLYSSKNTKQAIALQIEFFDVILVYSILVSLFAPVSEEVRLKYIKTYCSTWRVPFKKYKIPTASDMNKNKMNASRAEFNSVTRSTAMTSNSIATSKASTAKKSKTALFFQPYLKTLVELSFKVLCTAKLKVSAGYADGESRTQTLLGGASECSNTATDQYAESALLTKKRNNRLESLSRDSGNLNLSTNEDLRGSSIKKGLKKPPAPIGPSQSEGDFGYSEVKETQEPSAVFNLQDGDSFASLSQENNLELPGKTEGEEKKGLRMDHDKSDEWEEAEEGNGSESEKE